MLNVAPCSGAALLVLEVLVILIAPNCGVAVGGTGVLVGVLVAVLVGVLVGVLVAVLVGVLVGVLVAVLVGVALGVAVAIGGGWFVYVQSTVWPPEMGMEAVGLGKGCRRPEFVTPD